MSGPCRSGGPHEHALITRIRSGGTPDFEELRAAWQPSIPLLANLKGTPQDPEWHAEGDVANHTAMVLEETYRLLAGERRGAAPDERVALVLAALLHDIGKPLTTREAQVRGKARIVSPRHAEAGRNYLAFLLPRLGLSPPLQDRVLALVGYHHHPRKLVLDEAGPGAFAQLARMVDLEMVVALEVADLRGRVCPDLDEQLLQLELFRLQVGDFEIGKYSDRYWLDVMNHVFPDRGREFVRLAAARGRMDFETGRVRTVEEAIARAYQTPKATSVLTILAGPSGSGKTTWAKENGGGAAVVSLDELRERIAGRRGSQSKNGQVIQAAKEELRVQLRAGKPVIWDATNTRRDGRRWVVGLGYDYGAYVRIVVPRNSADALLARNQKREHPVPAAVLEKQLRGFQWPTLDEAHEVVVA